MQVFKEMMSAIKSKENKEQFYLNSFCPYKKEDILCGSWCALFYFQRAINNQYKKTSAHVILGCKAGEKLLFVNKLVEE